MKAKRSRKTISTSVTNHENHCPVPGGTLVVIGADFIKLQVLEAFKDATHKRDSLIEVITTASSMGTESFQHYQKVFEKIGINKVGHIQQHQQFCRRQTHNCKGSACAFTFR